MISLWRPAPARGRRVWENTDTLLVTGGQLLATTYQHAPKSFLFGVAVDTEMDVECLLFTTPLEDVLNIHVASIRVIHT